MAKTADKRDWPTRDFSVADRLPTGNGLYEPLESGDSKKKDAGKAGGFYLIPRGPLTELARVYKIGANKYEARGWEKGIEWSRVFDAMERHILAWLDGEQLDPVDGQHHLASVAWAAFALMEYEKTHPELDDLKRPNEARTP